MLRFLLRSGGVAVLLLLAACGGGSGNPAAAAPAMTAKNLATSLSRPSRLLIGLGSTNASDVKAQHLSIDIFDHYLVGAGDSGWPSWNSPRGAYVGVFAAQADSLNAVPMYTLYQMASNGDGNLSGLDDSSFMSGYWSNVTLLFQQLASYNKPALVNLEPDFWGYAQQQAPGGDPAQLAARVSINSDCAGLPDNVVGIAQCLMRSARKYAPRAYVGFPVSEWGANASADVVAFMNRIGADQADFIVITTLDRDAGCFEVRPQPASCSRSGSGWYWDESNSTHPNFHDHLAAATSYHQGIGGLPLLWWQTPLGVPSSVPGGASGHYRDNRMHYILNHATEFVAAGGVGVVFSAGAGGQTDITTDGGQFQNLSGQYLAAPAALP